MESALRDVPKTYLAKKVNFKETYAQPTKRAAASAFSYVLFTKKAMIRLKKDMEENMGCYE